MKNVKLLMLAITAMLFLGMGNLSAQESQSEAVIIRLIESYALNDGAMFVTHSGKTEKIVEIQKFRDLLKNPVDENAVILEKEINRWKKEGFRNNTISVASGTTYTITTVILSK